MFSEPVEAVVLPWCQSVWLCTPTRVSFVVPTTPVNQFVSIVCVLLSVTLREKCSRFRLIYKDPVQGSLLYSPARHEYLQSNSLVGVD